MVPDNGNEWRKFRVYLARTPCVPLVCTLFIRGGNRKAFRLPGAGGIVSIVRWNLRPVIFGVEQSKKSYGVYHLPGKTREKGIQEGYTP